MTAISSAASVHCAGCGKEQKASATSKGNARLPRGWKRHNEQTHCGDCWHAQYMLRAVTFHVASPADSDWPTFRAALNEQWGLFTNAANYMATELYVRDVKRDGTADKMPPMPKVYLYPDARAKFPAISPQAIAALEQQVQRKHRATRYEVIWTCERSLATAHYPQPIIVTAQSWTAKRDEGERPCVSVPLGQQRFLLRLKSGHRHARALKSFERLLAGEAIGAELSIYRKRAGESKVDQGQVRDRENGQRVSYDIVVKIVMWLPRPEGGRNRSGVLPIHTDADSLWVALNAKQEKLWVLNADHVRQWQAEHRRSLNRWSDDRKFENRPLATFAAKQSAAVDRHHNRIKTFCQQAAAQLVGYANRCWFAEIRYDDSRHDFAASFPWALLKQCVMTKCDEAGITFTDASGDVARESPADARGE